MAPHNKIITANSTPLSQRELDFMQHFLATGNAALSAMRAGYAPKCANNTAYKLLKKEKIQLALDAQRRALALDAQVTPKDIIAELRKVAFANMQDYMTVDDEGAPFLDLSAVTRDQTAALSEANTERYVEGKGKEQQPMKRAKIKLHNKIDALVSLGKIFGLFNEKHEHTGPDGGPILVAQRFKVEFVPCPTPNQPSPKTTQ